MALSISPKTRSQLLTLADFIVKALANELRAQGHNATGALIGSLTTRLQQKAEQTQIIGFMLRYGLALDSGVSAGRVRPGTAYIDAITRWLRAKGVTGGEQDLKSIAFAIRNAHLTQGIPTSNSARFSSARGRRRTGFLNVIDEMSRQITEFVAVAYDTELNLTMDEFVKHQNQLIKVA